MLEIRPAHVRRHGVVDGGDEATLFDEWLHEAQVGVDGLGPFCQDALVDSAPQAQGFAEFLPQAYWILV